MASDYLCKLTDKLNSLNTAVLNIQATAGLYADSSTEKTLTGRIKALEENVITSEPGETNISRMNVEHDVIVDAEGKIVTEYWPIGGCVNREVMLQNPEDPDIWEVVGGVTFDENIGTLHTTAYTGWKATVSYLYATKITVMEFDYVDADSEEVINLSTLNGTVYRVIITVIPTDGEDSDTDVDECVLRWEDVNDSTDYTEEVIATEHKRTINEEEFGHKFLFTGSSHIVIEIRNRLA